MGYIAYMKKRAKTNSDFIELSTKYLDNMVEKILNKTFFNFSADINMINIEFHWHSHTCITY